MKKSIRWKMTITFVIVMVCLIGSILLFNTLFLERIYINNKRDVIKQSYYALDKGLAEAYNKGYTLSELFTRRRGPNGEFVDSNLSSFLRELQEIYGVTTVLMDSENKTYSLFQNSSRLDRRMMDYIFNGDVNNIRLNVLEKTKNYTIGISDIRQPGFSSNLECFGFLSDNETAFLLNIPIESIEEPITLFNNALIIVSIITLIIGSILIFVLSNRLSKPLLELSKISKKMSRLEFENRYEGSAIDEIGILGNSMNEMSEKLEKSIKELKNANYMLKKDLEKKEQLDIMRQEFVANVSHELKTPISLIKGYAEGLETESVINDKENRDYYVKVIRDEADKMGDMVRELLDLSALERGMDNLDFSRISLSEIVEGVVKSFEIKLQEKNIKLETSIDENVYVWADGYKLEEVIRNYLSNAINHVNDKKIIKMSSEKINDSIMRLSVFNSGVILSDDDMLKVWEKFYKVDKAHTREYGGTGLGLSIVKAIADGHGTTCGCIGKEINGTQGMEFYFDLYLK